MAFIYIGGALLSIGNALSSPTLPSLISRQVGPREQGQILGVTQSVRSLTQIIAPIWGGTLFDAVGNGAPFWTAALWMIPAFIVIAAAGLKSQQLGIRTE